MDNVGKPLASLWDGQRIIATAPPSERQDMKESTVPPGWDKERARRVLAHDESPMREEAVGPHRKRLTCVCRQRRCVEHLDKAMERQENRGNRWSSKDVIGRSA